MDVIANLRLGRVPVMTSILGALLVGWSTACGSPSTVAVVSSPTPDLVTRNYVALIHNYWIWIQAADQFSNGVNFAARVCLGKTARNASTELELIDAPACRERAVAILAVQQKFLSELDATPAPAKFAADDRAFRSQIPKAISDVKALIAAANTGSKDAVLQATMAYVSDMIPTVTSALDEVDPPVVHN